MDMIGSVKNTDRQPFFSVLVPVYNKESKVERCLTSILNQTYDDLEVIVVDDGSDDGSYEKVLKISESDRRVRLLKNEKNESLLATRIVAMKEAKGKYILNVDSDDHIDLETCRILHEELENKEHDILSFGYIEEPSGMEHPCPELPDDILRAVFERKFPHNLCFLCCSSDLIQRLLGVCSSFYCNMSEDMYFSSILTHLAGSFYRINASLYIYEREGGMTNPDHLSFSQLENMVLSVENKSTYLRKYFEKYDPEMLGSCDKDRKNDSDYIAELIKNSRDDLYDRFGNLRYLDQKMNTSYSEQYERKIENDAYNYGLLISSGSGFLILSFIKLFIKRVGKVLGIFKNTENR